MQIIKSVSVTGHRPNKLGWGYNYNELHWIRLKEMFKTELKRLHATDAYSGMALGVDTVFAMAVIELKKEGYNIRLHASIPCNNQCGKWFDTSKNLYYELLSKADEIVGMSEENSSGYETVELFSIKNNITGKNDYVLLKRDAIKDIDFKVTPFNKSMMYQQIYKPYLMQKRNIYMVDRVEDVIAVWDGTSGGTGNCVVYARKSNKNIIHIDPKII